jgi:hypothetical protein
LFVAVQCCIATSAARALRKVGKDVRHVETVDVDANGKVIELRI